MDTISMTPAKAKEAFQGSGVLALVCVCLVLAPGVAAAVTTPHLLPLQGSVADSLDQPLTTGNLSVQVYDVSTGGSPLYDSGADFDGSITNGRLDVILGSATPMSLDNTVLHFMEIHVNGEVVIGETNGGRYGFYPGAGDHSRPDLEARLDTLEAELGISAPQVRLTPRAEAFAGSSSNFQLSYGLLGIGRAVGSATSYQIEGNLLLQPVGLFVSSGYRLRLGPFYLPESETDLIVLSVQDTVLVLGGGSMTVEVLDDLGVRLSGRSSVLSLQSAQGLVSQNGPATENPDTTYLLGFTAGSAAGFDTITVKVVPATASLIKTVPILVTHAPDQVVLTPKSLPARIHPGETLHLNVEILNALGGRVPDERQPFSLSSLGCGSLGSPVFESDSSYTMIYQGGGSACLDTLELFDPEAATTSRDTLAIEVTERAIILSVLDVGNDQGRQVRLIWKYDLNDTSGAPTPIAYYVVWRRVDQLPSPGVSQIPLSRMSSALAALSENREFYLLDANNVLWEPVGPQIPTQLFTQYASVVPTLADSNIVNGMHYSVFYVSAHTQNPQVFFKSEPDSGYSIDNLVPEAPMGLAMSGSGILTWDDATEADFDYFTVYGSSSPSRDGSAELLATTVNPSQDVSQDSYGYYFVATTDFNGNEGPDATVSNVVSVPDSGLPPFSFSLLQSRPNPFRSVTSIAFEMPRSEHARLKVFDSQGRYVSTLAARVFEAGVHQVTWSGRSEDGQRVPVGVYFYRLETESFQATRKLLLIK